MSAPPLDYINVCPEAQELREIVNEVHCPYCRTVFNSSSRLDMHLAKFHKEGKLEKKKGIFQYFCPEDSCKYALTETADKTLRRFFSKLKYLKQHYQKVHLEKKFKCEKCMKYFTSERLRASHIEKECQVDFSCQTCSKSYNTKSALLTHCKRNNHGPAPIARKNKNKVLMQKERKLVPKVQESVQMEDIAAAALSELSWKVVVRKGVDVGVQTDHRSCSRRRIKKDTKTQTQRVSCTISTQTETQDILDQISDHFSSSTQTNSDKLMLDLGMFQDIDQHVNNHTQTELINQSLILDDDSPIILSDTHTQTMGLDDYSHNYTQTCTDFLLQDFVELSDIETQTAWASLTMEDPCLVSAQTQTLL